MPCAGAEAASDAADGVDVAGVDVACVADAADVFDVADAVDVTGAAGVWNANTAAIPNGIVAAVIELVILVINLGIWLRSPEVRAYPRGKPITVG